MSEKDYKEKCNAMFAKNTILLNKISQLENEIDLLNQQLNKEKELNRYIKARFVECNTCTQDKREKCLMFTEGFCEGERCTELVDLEELINKGINNSLKNY